MMASDSHRVVSTFFRRSSSQPICTTVATMAIAVASRMGACASVTSPPETRPLRYCWPTACAACALPSPHLKTPKKRMTGNRSNRNFMAIVRLFQFGHRRKAQRCGIDAVAQAGRWRAVVEDVAEMGIADVADDFGAYHAVAAVDLFLHHRRIQRLEVAGPAAAGFEFCIRGEQRRAAADAGVDAGFVMIPVAAGERRFGGGMARDGILLVVQL